METPKRLGPYRITSVLGQGGMGVVYRGEHESTGQAAAIKTVYAPDEMVLASIRREIHALAALRHPGIVRILAEGVDDGLPWCAMELLDGVTMRQWLGDASRPTADDSIPTTGTERPTERTPHAAARAAEPPADATVSLGSSRHLGLDSMLEPVEPETAPSGPRPTAASGKLEAVIEVVRRLCSPLAFLHGEGIVHRDLKQENILIRPDGRPVLIDFGITTQFAAGAGRETLELDGDVVVGTPAFIAPEHIQGELVDARADLYSLGCILYELLTGRPPFQADSLPAVFRKHVSARPLPPSRLVDGIPPQLDELILRLLAKSPKDRLGYADDVAGLLAALSATERGDDEAPTPRVYLYRPGFAGREDDLDALEPMLDALRDRRGGVAFVGGESGVGKTRFAIEIGRRAERRGFPAATGECLPPAVRTQGTSGALHPFRRLFEWIADRARENQAEAERLLGRHGKILAAFEPSFGEIPALAHHPEAAEVPGDAARLRAFRSLVAVLQALVQKEPRLLLLDDLQWADDLTLGFLDFLLRRGYLDSTPLLVVGTYRSDEAPPALRALLGLPRTRSVELGRLDESAVRSMISDMLALADPPAFFVRKLADSSHGNPFFVAEYLRAAIEGGLLDRDRSGQWRLRRDLGQDGGTIEIQLPNTLRELVARRLDGLGSDARSLVAVASVLGREFSSAILRQLVGGAGEATFLAASSELLRRQILEEYEPGRLRFLHDKIREISYDAIAADRRRDLHRKVATILEALAERERPWAVIGLHWERAGVVDRAGAAYLTAARRAAARWSHGEAERLYGGYLSLIRTPNVESIAARNELARQVLWAQGKNLAAIDEHRRALAEAEALGDPRSQATSLQGLSSVLRMTGQPQDAQLACERALEIVRSLGDRAGEGTCLTILAAAHVAQGQLDSGRQLFEAATAIHRERGNRTMEAISKSNVAVVLRELGDTEGARRLQEEALALHREVGNRRSEGITLENLAVLATDESLFDEARQLFDEALAVLRSVGDRRYEGEALGHLALLELELGHPELARRRLDEAVEILRDVGDRGAEAEAALARIEVERRSGRSALDGLERIESVLRELGNPLWIARALIERGHAEGGVQHLQAAELLVVRSGVPAASPLGRRLASLRASVLG